MEHDFVAVEDARNYMDSLLTLAAEPAAWAALFTLIAMEIVLGIDNLIFIAILTNRLPEQQRNRLAVSALVRPCCCGWCCSATIATIVKLTAPVLTILGQGFSWRDMILIAGGLFLVWKATKEIHHRVDHDPGPTVRPATVGLALPRRSARSCCSTSCSRSTASSPLSA